jgi:hypothetical protein
MKKKKRVRRKVETSSKASIFLPLSRRRKKHHNFSEVFVELLILAERKKNIHDPSAKHTRFPDTFQLKSTHTFLHKKSELFLLPKKEARRRKRLRFIMPLEHHSFRH